MDASGSPHTPGQTAPGHDHVVEFYETEAFLVGTVADFVVPALRCGDAAIVVATAQHRAAFAAAIDAEGVDLAAAIADGRYQAFDAADLLATFMVDGAPDADRFEAVIGTVVDRAAASGRRVKVYGEMVALLWADGEVNSTIAVEDLWNDLAAERSFSLLCAYPMGDFDDATRAAFKQICTQHSEVLPVEAPAPDDALADELRAQADALRAQLTRLQMDTPPM